MPSKTYKVGTLTYTFQRLFIVFFWMLWGALAMNMMNLVFRKSTPFIFEAYGLSDTFKIMLLGTTCSLMNVVMNPIRRKRKFKAVDL